MNVKADGDGYDIGLRMTTSRTLFRREGSDDGWRVDFDFNYAISLHGALFTTTGSFEAESVDQLTKEAYDEDETGLFFRPVAALQPIFSVNDRVSS